MRPSRFKQRWASRRPVLCTPVSLNDPAVAELVSLPTLPLRVTAAACSLLLLMALAAPARADYVSIIVDEVSGHERHGWPIQVGVPIAADHSPEELWLAKVGADDALEPVAFQVLDVFEVEWPGDELPRNAVKGVEVVFLADLPADASVTYRMYHGDEAREQSPADAPTGLTIETDEGLARTVDTGPVRFAFHRHSGQLLHYHPAGAEREFNFAVPDRLRPVHHNPDTWAPPQSWGHTSGWDIEQPEAAPHHKEARGPIAWRTVRTGELPRVPGSEAAVTYTAFAGMPFLLESSELRFTRNTPVIAVRNNELVFSRGQHTHGLYIDHAGQTHAFPAFDPDDPEKHFAHLSQRRLPPDTPLMALFNDTRRYGIGMVTLTRHAASNRIPSAQASGAYYYFNDGMESPNPENHFLYFARAEVFHYTGNQWNTTVVPAGSVYAESSAILVFEVGDDEQSRFEQVEHWTRLLRNPPRVSLADGVRVLPR